MRSFLCSSLCLFRYHKLKTGQSNDNEAAENFPSSNGTAKYVIMDDLESQEGAD